MDDAASLGAQPKESDEGAAPVLFETEDAKLGTDEDPESTSAAPPVKFEDAKGGVEEESASVASSERSLRVWFNEFVENMTSVDDIKHGSLAALALMCLIMGGGVIFDALEKWGFLKSCFFAMTSAKESQC